MQAILRGMGWLERHAWWVLLLVAAMLVAFGITDILGGAAADPAIPLGLTGKTNAELQAESADAFRMFDFFTRVNGASLLFIGVLAAAVILVPFRRNERWAWWATWTLPIWAAGAALFYIVAGTRPDVPPPPPLVSGPIVAVLCAAALQASAPRFFRRSGPA
jgi:hypothetical protein